MSRPRLRRCACLAVLAGALLLTGLAAPAPAVPSAQAQAQAQAHSQAQSQSQALAPAGVSPCPAAGHVRRTDALPHLAGAVGSTLNILAIGSGTLLGPQARISGSFPDYMVADLRTRLPGTQIVLDVAGGRGMTAVEMLALLRARLARGSYGLVLWQTGTVEAIHHVPPEDLLATLLQGIDAAHASGADVVLVDAQFSRMLNQKVALEPYEDTLRDAARQPGVALFSRFDLMRQWAGAGAIDLEHSPQRDRKSSIELLNRCLGQDLASQMLETAGLAVD